jgi:transmembrane sensor
MRHSRPHCEEEGASTNEQVQIKRFLQNGYRVERASCVYLYERIMNLPPRLPTNRRDIDGDALDWLIHRTGGEFGERDEATFQAWLHADDSHRQAYERQEMEWTALERLPADGLDILRANLAQDLATEAASTPFPAKTRTAHPQPGCTAKRLINPARRRHVAAAFSAAAVALIAGTSSFMAWNHWQAQPVFVQAFHTQRGQQLDVPLPDGSQLRLDTATRLEVSYYRDRREVQLSEGQVVFSVQSDAARPFKVLAGPLRITVVGTRFSVRHTPAMAGADGVRVAVEQGRVKVERIHADLADDAPATPLFLSAGQQIVSDAQGLLAQVASLSSAGMAPWRDNLVSFDNTRLDQVLAELERYGNTGLVVYDPAVASLRVTGTFNPTRLDNFASVLPKAAPVRLRKVGRAMEIVAAP